MLFIIVSLNAFAQDSAQWGLPEGAKARLGRGIINELKYSPGGTLLAVASDSGVWLYDTATGEAVTPMRRGNSFAARSVAFSPDGRTLASGGGILCLWDVATGEPKHTLHGNLESVRLVAFSPDGRTLAGVGGGSIRIWDATTGAHKRSLLSQHLDLFECVAFSPDGRTLAIGNRSHSVGGSVRDGIIFLWDVVTGERIDAWSEGLNKPTSLAFSPDGRTLAIGSVGWAGGFGTWGSVTLWDMETGTHKHKLTGHTGGVKSVAYSPDGRTLAIASWPDPSNHNGDDTVRLYDAVTVELKRTLEGHVWGVHSVAYSTDGRTIAIASWDGRLSVWDAETGTHMRQLEEHTGKVSSVAFSPDGRTIATGSWVGFDDWRGPGGSVRLFDAVTGVHKFTLEGHTRGVKSVAFSPDGRTLASGSWDKTVRLWNVVTGAQVRRLKAPDHVWSVAFSPDGRTLASAGGNYDGTVRLWNAETGAHIRTLNGHLTGVVNVAFSPDGHTLVSASNGEIRLWHAETGALKRTLHPSGGGRSIESVAFSSDGRTLAVGNSIGIHFWDVATGVKGQTLIKHRGQNTFVTYSPEGYMLASGTSEHSDRTVRLWDVVTGAQRRSLEGHTGDINTVTFSPDGRTLASGGSDGTVLLWEITPSAEVLPDETPHVVEPLQIAPDVNDDGSVDVQDLLLVAGDLGQSVHTRADVNGDKIVNVLDVMLVAGLVDNLTGNLPIYTDGAVMPRTTEVTMWLEGARRLGLPEPILVRGIQFLQNLLAALTPNETVLLPNYPNPFNPETWIPYQLARDVSVQISIYSAKGALVRHLHLGLQPAGFYTDKHHAAYWDGRNEGGELVANGLYVFEFHAGTYRASGRMAIAK